MSAHFLGREAEAQRDSATHPRRLAGAWPPAPTRALCDPGPLGHFDPFCALRGPCVRACPKNYVLK